MFTRGNSRQGQDFLHVERLVTVHQELSRKINCSLSNIAIYYGSCWKLLLIQYSVNFFKVGIPCDMFLSQNFIKYHLKDMSPKINEFQNLSRNKIRSSHRRCSAKKGILRNFAKFTGKHLCQSLYFNKVAGLRHATLLKKKPWHKGFPVNFPIFLRTSFLQNTS